MKKVFLAVLGPRNTDQDARLTRLRTAQADLSLITQSPQMILFATSRMEMRAIQGGAIFGSFYSRESVDRRHLDNGRQNAILGSRGKAITDGYWGSYVAVWNDPDRMHCHVLKSPTGQLACYRVTEGGCTYLSNSVDLLLAAAAAEPKFEWSAIVDHLLFNHFRSPITAIRGVTELVGGTRLSCHAGRCEISTLWSPWDFTGREAEILDVETACEKVATVTRSCVTTMAGGYKKVLLGMSGGLDSSIIAACLAGCATETTGFTLVTGDAAGDERHYARPLADALGLPLIDLLEDTSLVDVTRSLASSYPRPIARSFAQSGDTLQQGLAEHVDAEAYFTGAGGDNVFAYIPSVSPIADRLLREGIGTGVLATAADISRLTGASAASLLLSAMRRAWLRRPAYRWPKLASFLGVEALKQASYAPAHPWLDPPGHALPGKAAHIAWLLGIQNHLEGFGREKQRPLVSPLMAQPLVEACLRIPTWMWCLEGNNRAIARMAFAPSLPIAITSRRSKGTPDGFAIAIFEASRTTIREMLLDGMLARECVIDRSAVADAFERPHLSSADYLRLLALCDVEAWVRSWLGKTHGKAL